MRAKADSVRSFSSLPGGWNRTGALFPAIGVLVLIVGIMFVSTGTKDAWVLQSILPAILVFSVFVGIGIVLGQFRPAVLYGAIALALLAIVPSIKYGFVYGEFDALGHYSTAAEIARTGFLWGITKYSEGYAPMPIMHVCLAVIGLIAHLPIEVAIVYALFSEHFVIFVLIYASVQRIFPAIERRVIVFLCLATLPIISTLTGTTYGLFTVAVLTYVLSTMTSGKKATRGVLLTTMLLVLLIWSHFVTTLYLLLVLTAYAISMAIMRHFGAPKSGENSRSMFALLSRFYVFFLLWLAYIGQDYIYVLQYSLSGLFQESPFPSAMGQLAFVDLVQVVVFKEARYLPCVVVLVVSCVALVRYPKDERFFSFFFWLFAVSLAMGGTIALGRTAVEVYRFLAYASLTVPYFACLVISRRKKPFRLANGLHVRSIKAMMLAALVVSMVAAYPITPLYPRFGGSAVMDDNTVNSVYAVSGLNHFSSVYSNQPVMTSGRIFSQMMSLHPELSHLAYNTISPDLELASPGELEHVLVVFDMGGKSGTATLPMRQLAGNLRNTFETNTADIVYTNGLFYIALVP